ncbi:MAG: peptide chain release factor N(5)-glutamine methyltransferase [Candidatus Omnitrophica bacterium]|nr:peptide chain release factor N(5)-glutamine methyltransferase [Candidatus Omnitrophota bacterium]
MLDIKAGKDQDIRYVMKWALNELKQAEIVSARKEAEILLSNLLDCNFAELYLRGDRMLETKVLIRFKGLIRKRCQGAPLQYLTRETCFYGLKLYVGKGVFIPRPETEVLVERIIELVQENIRKPVRILELCTGSGNISVALTKNLQYCKIISSDISPQALVIARQNAKMHGLQTRIEFAQGDLFSALSEIKDGNDRFDIIIANPPYIARQELKNLPQDVGHEPRNALDGGEDGLMFYKKIISGVKPYLKNSGYIAFEFGDTQRQSIEEIICNSQLFENPFFFSDLNGIVRFVIVRRSCG